jgi:hypothetical protein
MARLCPQSLESMLIVSNLGLRNAMLVLLARGHFALAFFIPTSTRGSLGIGSRFAWATTGFAH